jgi:hypothetical protein
MSKVASPVTGKPAGPLAGSAHREAHAATTAPSFRTPSTPCGAPTLPPPSPVKGRRRYSSRWTIVPPSASAFTPMREPHASRLWNQYARACADTSAASRPTSRTASRCDTITVRSTCQTTSKGRSRSSASKVHPPASVHPRGTAVPNGSSDFEGEPVVGSALPNHRGTAAGTARSP